MCLFLYIASDHELPTIPWNEADPTPICVQSIGEDDPGRRHLTKPYAYVVGAFEGCSCGFEYGQHPAVWEPEEEQREIESVRHLREYLEKALDYGPIEAYCAWADEELLPPESRQTVTPSHFGGDAFTLNKREFLLVVKEAVDKY